MEKEITNIRISRKGLKNGMKKNINCPIGKIILDKKEDLVKEDLVKEDLEKEDLVKEVKV